MCDLEKYVVLQKAVGETPLQCVETWRQTRPDLVGVPLAYAGRLDPMASGKLLILIGAECQNQEKYHGLDKAYEFSILFGISSDSGDVLGLLKEAGEKVISEDNINKLLPKLVGPIELPYPIFSSRTVKGKPLHTWAMEDRLDEITIPTKQSEIYQLSLVNYQSQTRQQIFTYASQKIELIPKVTELRKALGNDFRRSDVRLAWAEFAKTGRLEDEFTVAKISCLASSGTYMRTLAEVIAQTLNSTGLAYTIERQEIGVFDKALGTWRQTF